MVVILFRSRLRPGDPGDYPERAARMLALAREMPGFRSFRSFVAEDGERLSVIEFESEDHLRAWREHPEHAEAMRMGRERYYAEYRLDVLEPLRTSRFVHEG